MATRKNNRKQNDKNSRSKVITYSGYLFICTNFGLGIINIIIGLIAGSIAITSDAMHSFIDSVSGFLIVASEKLASHHKFSKQRTQIERGTTIIVALIIIATGIHIIMEAIEHITETESPDYSIPVMIVLIISIILKYTLAQFLKQNGKIHHSDVLTASGAETMNDTWISVAVLVSAIIYLIWHIDIEAYISIIIATIILKVGLEFIFPHISHHHHHHLETDSDHDHCGKNKQS